MSYLENVTAICVADKLPRNRGAPCSTVVTAVAKIYRLVERINTTIPNTIYNALRKRGLIVEKGTKVSYALPKSA